MKKLLTKLALSFLLATGLVACQKETEVLPENSQETASGRSVPGPMEFMQRGPNGSVVIYSGWINKTESDWSGFGTFEILTSLTAPSLSDDIVNKGVVLVYFDHFGEIKSLPEIWLEGANSMVLNYSFIKQKITLKLKTGGTLLAGIIDLPFRYILIPGNSQASGRMNHSPVDYNDYDAVCKYYGIAK